MCFFLLHLPSLYMECAYEDRKKDNLLFSSQIARPLGTTSKPDGKDWALLRDHGLSGGAFAAWAFFVCLPWAKVSVFYVLEIQCSLTLGSQKD